MDKQNKVINQPVEHQWRKQGFLPMEAGLMGFYWRDGTCGTKPVLEALSRGRHSL